MAQPVGVPDGRDPDRAHGLVRHLAAAESAFDPARCHPQPAFG